jgi:hypothetical protein
MAQMINGSVGKMSEKMSERIVDAVGGVGKMSGRMSERIADAFGDSLGAARHAARRAENAAGDLLYSTSRSIKRHPGRTVLTSVGVAFAAGMLVGRICRRS